MAKVPYRSPDLDVMKIIVGRFPEQRICFHAVHDVGKLWGLAVVVENEPGYYPVPIQITHGSMDRMMEAAKELNRNLFRMSDVDALELVATSMPFNKNYTKKSNR